MHVGETDLKQADCLIWIPEEKKFMKILKFELLGAILKSPTDGKLSYHLLDIFKTLLTSWRKKKSFCGLQMPRSNHLILEILNSSVMTSLS